MIMNQILLKKIFGYEWTTGYQVVKDLQKPNATF